MKTATLRGAFPQRRAAVCTIFIEREVGQMKTLEARLIEAVIARHAVQRLQARIRRRHAASHHFHHRVAAGDAYTFLAAPRGTCAAHVAIHL